MANDTTIAGVLAFLHELFPTRPVTPATLDAFSLIFADWPDAELNRCAVEAARESGRTFFPTPGEIAAYRAHYLPPVMDHEFVLRQIEKLSVYNPHRGMVPPRIDEVREKLGAHVAAAYALGGGCRIFADGETTRDIARREFEKALQDIRTNPREYGLPPIAAPIEAKQLSA